MKSALSRLYSNDGNPNICNLSLYDICDVLFTNFVALCCTFSIAILSFFTLVAILRLHTLDAGSLVLYIV